MADGGHPNPDSEARKWFVITMVCAILYVGVVFVFVVHGKLDSETAQKEEAPQHEQSN
jgi:flagellar basal body-associated protein FliL